MGKRALCALLALVCLVMTGCSGVREVLYAEQRDAVKDAVAEELRVEFDDGAEERSPAVMAGEDAARYLRQKVRWHVEETGKESCTVEFTAPDMRAILSGAANELQAQGPMSPEDYDAAVYEITLYISDRLCAADCPMKTQTVDVSLQDGQPVIGYEVYDAMYGGLLTALEQMEAIYGG